ncbi:hypothetical protein MHU86_3989 [Fragilaria crotonensis]|nr:hypothetical protein MHU86_3989 [Fragilaria crotonensis]
MKVASVLLVSSLTVSTSFILAPPGRIGSSFCRVAAEQEQGDVLLYSDSGVPDFDAMMDDEFDDDDDDEFDEEEEDDEGDSDEIRKPHARWSSLKQNKVTDVRKTKKDRVVDPRFESKQDKKRRMMMFVKTKDRERKMAARVERKIPLTMRTPLSALKSGAKMSGIIISITKFGAYVDIGTECDGLLHISQISNTYFVENLRKHLTPGDEVEVTIKSLNPEKKKLHLTMLPPEEAEDDDDGEERIILDEIEIDDELWGEIVRVTDFGSYVELGAEVKGFLHFMDHPLFGSEPELIRPRTWRWETEFEFGPDVDRERSRVKLTANRPSHLPGPRRELF